MNVQSRKKALSNAHRAQGIYFTTVIFINRRCFAPTITIDSPVARVLYRRSMGVTPRVLLP